MACFIGLSLGACGGDDDDGGDGTTAGTGSPEQTGSVCEGPEQCYPDVADGELLGDALCLTRVRGGYCTHTCTADDDCCAAPDECETDLEQVCSPFESTGQMMCFLSCEADAIPDDRDEQEYCQQEASRDFICRSSGGGSTNRKVCVPGDCGVGAACGSDADCGSDLSCSLSIRGGYCTVACSVTSDCPTGSRCAALNDDESYCYRECAAESDCSFCRGDNLRGSCTTDVSFADSDDSVAVCAPPS
jgi:hypothetical protein